MLPDDSEAHGLCLGRRRVPLTAGLRARLPASLALTPGACALNADRRLHSPAESLVVVE